jgi:hypothetical protein
MEFNIELLPKIIYKYRNFENEFHKRIITHQEIYFAKTSEFLPSYDLKYSFDIGYIKNENNRRKYYKEELKLENINYPIIDNYIKEIIITEKLLDKLEAKSREYYESTFGIFSARETYKNENLWKIFTDNQKGFCVGFDFIKTFPLNQGFKGPVEYVKNEDLPKDKLLNNNNFDEFKNIFLIGSLSCQKYTLTSKNID